MSLGVFGGFDVSVQSQIPNHDYGSLQARANATQNASQVINVGGATINNKSLIEKGSMISIKDNQDLTPTSSVAKPQITVDPSTDHLIYQDMRKVNATTTNRSRLSNYRFMNEGTLVNGLVHATHQSFYNQKFLTESELKTGNIDSIKQVERSLSKLHDLQSKNWSIQDANYSTFISPSNFKQKYGTGTDTINEVLDNVLKTKNKRNLVAPRDIRNQQMAQITELIREKR